MKKETQRHEMRVEGRGRKDRGRGGGVEGAIYLEEGCLGPTLFKYIAGFANGHNYTLHVWGQHRLQSGKGNCG